MDSLDVTFTYKEFDSYEDANLSAGRGKCNLCTNTFSTSLDLLRHKCDHLKQIMSTFLPFWDNSSGTGCNICSTVVKYLPLLSVEMKTAVASLNSNIEYVCEQLDQFVVRMKLHENDGPLISCDLYCVIFRPKESNNLVINSCNDNYHRPTQSETKKAQLKTICEVINQGKMHLRRTPNSKLKEDKNVNCKENKNQRGLSDCPGDELGLRRSCRKRKINQLSYAGNFEDEGSDSDSVSTSSGSYFEYSESDDSESGSGSVRVSKSNCDWDNSMQKLNQSNIKDSKSKGCLNKQSLNCLSSNPPTTKQTNITCNVCKKRFIHELINRKKIAHIGTKISNIEISEIAEADIIDVNDSQSDNDGDTQRLITNTHTEIERNNTQQVEYARSTDDVTFTETPAENEANSKINYVAHVTTLNNFKKRKCETDKIDSHVGIQSSLIENVLNIQRIHLKGTPGSKLKENKRESLPVGSSDNLNDKENASVNRIKLDVGELVVNKRSCRKRNINPSNDLSNVELDRDSDNIFKSGSSGSCYEPGDNPERSSDSQRAYKSDCDGDDSSQNLNDNNNKGSSRPKYDVHKQHSKRWTSKTPKTQKTDEQPAKKMRFIKFLWSAKTPTSNFVNGNINSITHNTIASKDNKRKCYTCNHTLTRSFNNHVKTKIHSDEAKTYIKNFFMWYTTCDRYYYNITDKWLKTDVVYDLFGDLINLKEPDRSINEKQMDLTKENVCFICDLSFTSTRQLRSHMHNTKHIIFPDWHQKKSIYFKRHLELAKWSTSKDISNNNLGSADIKCRICSKNMSQLDAVKHFKWHAKHNAYKCNVCNKRYIFKSSLVDHMAHSGCAISTGSTEISENANGVKHANVVEISASNSDRGDDNQLISQYESNIQPIENAVCTENEMLSSKPAENKANGEINCEPQNKSSELSLTRDNKISHDAISNGKEISVIVNRDVDVSDCNRDDGNSLFITNKQIDTEGNNTQPMENAKSTGNETMSEILAANETNCGTGPISINNLNKKYISILSLPNHKNIALSGCMVFDGKDKFENSDDDNIPILGTEGHNIEPIANNRSTENETLSKTPAENEADGEINYVACATNINSVNKTCIFEPSLSGDNKLSHSGCAISNENEISATASIDVEVSDSNRHDINPPFICYTNKHTETEGNTKTVENVGSTENETLSETPIENEVHSGINCGTCATTINNLNKTYTFQSSSIADKNIANSDCAISSGKKIVEMSGNVEGDDAEISKSYFDRGNKQSLIYTNKRTETDTNSIKPVENTITENEMITETGVKIQPNGDINFRPYITTIKNINARKCYTCDKTLGTDAVFRSHFQCKFHTNIVKMYIKHFFEWYDIYNHDYRSITDGWLKIDILKDLFCDLINFNEQDDSMDEKLPLSDIEKGKMCCICDMIFTSIHSLKEHLNTKKHIMVAARRKKISSYFKKHFETPTFSQECNIGDDSVVSLKSGDVKCRICLVNVAQLDTVKHFIIHAENGKHKCDVCNKTYFFESSLKYHKDNEHNGTENCQDSGNTNDIEASEDHSKSDDDNHPLTYYLNKHRKAERNDSLPAKRTMLTKRTSQKTTAKNGGSYETKCLACLTIIPYQNRHKCYTCNNSYHTNFSYHRQTKLHTDVVKSYIKDFFIWYTTYDRDYYNIVDDWLIVDIVNDYFDDLITSNEQDSDTNGNIETTKCHVCDMSFPFRKCLSKHKQSNKHKMLDAWHKKKSFYFRKQFEIANYLQVPTNKDNSVVNLTNGDIQCRICSKMMSQFDAIEHFKYHIGENNYACEICGKTYIFQSSLNDHKNSTNHNDYLKCKHKSCAPRTNEENAVHYHKFVTHSCGNTFYRSSLFSDGIDIVYNCRICGRNLLEKFSAFSHSCYSKNLEEPLKCHLCFKGPFNNQFILQEHVEKHDELHRKCPFCEAMFMTTKAVHRHLKQVHKL